MGCSSIIPLLLKSIFDKYKNTITRYNPIGQWMYLMPTDEDVVNNTIEYHWSLTNMSIYAVSCLFIGVTPTSTSVRSGFMHSSKTIVKKDYYYLSGIFA